MKVSFLSSNFKFSIEIEKNMPNGIVFAAYSAYKFRFKDIPADYSEVYIYGDVDLVEKRFPKDKGPSNYQNLFVLRKDPFILDYGEITTIANIYVNLWNIKTWYAYEFIKSLDKRLFG